MQIRLGSWLALSVMLTSAAALATACGGGDSGGGAAGTGGSSVGGSNATGGQGGGAGAGGSTSGGGGSSGASGAAGAAGSGGAAGATGTGGTGGAAPMCSTSAECKEADVSIPGSTTAPTPTATSCVGGQCGLVTSYSGAYKTPKSPRSCTEICAASTYDGKAMECSASCQKKTVNGFGDQSLVFDDGADAGPGSVAGLVTYQFSPLSGGYKFIEVGCAEVPKSKYIQGSNSYTYVNHRCCCVAP